MNELLLQLNADQTYKISSQRIDKEEGSTLILQVGNEEISFPLDPFDAARIAFALVELKTVPSTIIAVPPPGDGGVLLKDIRPIKRHTHRHCEVCNEPICKLVQAREPKV